MADKKFPMRPIGTYATSDAGASSADASSAGASSADASSADAPSASTLGSYTPVPRSFMPTHRVYTPTQDGNLNARTVASTVASTVARTVAPAVIDAPMPPRGSSSDLSSDPSKDVYILSGTLGAAPAEVPKQRRAPRPYTVAAVFIRQDGTYVAHTANVRADGKIDPSELMLPGNLVEVYHSGQVVIHTFNAPPISNPTASVLTSPIKLNGTALVIVRDEWMWVDDLTLPRFERLLMTDRAK